MTEEIRIDGVNVAGCEHLYGDNCCDDTKLSVDCAKNNCRYKEYKHLQRENKEKVDIIEQMIKILYPNASDDELYDVTFNGEYIDKLKELKDTADTMLMANDIKKQDIDSLREANTRLEQENFALTQESQQKSQTICELKQENERLKKDFSSYEDDIEDWVSDNSILYQYDDRTPDTLEELQACMESTHEQWQKYKQALEEIREIAKFNQFYNPEDLLINGDIGQIQDLKMTEIYKRIIEVLND